MKNFEKAVDTPEEIPLTRIQKILGMLEYYRKQIPLKIKIYSGDYEIKKLLKKSKIFIPIFPMSTTLFTAKEFKNIIITYRFMNMRPSIIFEELIDYTADSTKELYSYVKKLIDK